MDAALASGLVGAQLGKVQMAVAAKLLKMNADAENAVVKLIDSAQQNVASLANVAAGIGGNLNISV